MGLIQALKDFLTKRNFDLDDTDVNLHKYHPQLKIFFACNGVFFNNTESKLRLVWPFICVFLATVALCLETILVIHGVVEKDYALATESFCYILIVACIPIVIFSVICNRGKIMHIFDRMNNDFIQVCALGPRHKVPFLRGQLIIWQLCYIWLTFSSIVAGMFLMTCYVALIYQSLFATQDENTVRPLAFPIWLSFDDPYRTPNYELLLALESMIPAIFVQSFSVFIYIYFHISLHCHYMVEMIFLDLDVLFDGLDETVATLSKFDSRRIEVQLNLNSRMKRIVDWHTSIFRMVENSSSVFGPPLAFQVTFSAIAICFVAYQIVDNFEQGKIHFLFVLMFIAICLQLWIPCYLGSLVRNQAFEVGEACWRCGWQNTPLGQLLRSDIIIIILRAQRPVNIKFPGLPKLELETFSSLMSTSYSYFNIIRQYK